MNRKYFLEKERETSQREKNRDQLIVSKPRKKVKKYIDKRLKAVTLTT